MTARFLEPPLSEDQLRPLEAAERRVQFKRLPTDDELRRVAALIETRTDVQLSVAGAGGDIRDLEFLRFFPSVRSFSVDGWRSLQSFDGLGHLSKDLQRLAITSANPRLSIRPIEHFSDLRVLYVDGNHRDIDVVGRLRSLEDLTLRSITLPDLTSLLPLDHLRSFDLKLGGTRDLSLLPSIGRLEYLEIWRVSGLDDVSALAQIPTLKHVFLQALKHVTGLPAFDHATGLRRVDLQTMSGLTDLAPLARAPGLEILNLLDFRHADPSILLPFVGHPTLRAGIWGFGSDRKNFAAQDLLPLQPEPAFYAKARRGENAVYGAMPWDEPDWTGYRRRETEV